MYRSWKPGVVNSGTETEAVLDFKLPAKVKGDISDGLELDYSFSSIQEMRDKKDTLKEETLLLSTHTVRLTTVRFIVLLR